MGEPRQGRQLVIGLFLAVVVLGIGAAIWIGSGGGDSRDLQKVLQENGFVELRPPSTLIQPGAWVEVQKRNPLQLGTVCSAQSALQLTKEQLAESTSADTTRTRAFTGSFNIGLEALGFGDVASKAKIIKAVELRLSSIRLIELSDDQILKNLPKRELSCTEAIKLRYQNNPKSLTMIDTVLIADAEYQFTFDGQADTNAKTAAVEEFAAKANLAVDVNREDSTAVLGSNLVWGVRDDQFMAYQGIALPEVGASSEDKRSILQDSGPIEVIDQTQQVRRSFDSMPVRVRLDVPVMKQPSSMSCWATVYAMMASWKTKKDVTIESAIAALGVPYTTYLAEDRGLPGGQELSFVEIAGLQALPPASYPLSTFRTILHERGPAWIITGNGITSHARVLVGIYGPDEEEKIATYEATVMEFIDPALGAYVYEPALSFLEEFEREAAYVVEHHLDSIDLRWQVLSY
jgi:hypothetical protein